MSDSDLKRTSRTDWERLANMTDDEIDYSDIPPLSGAFFERAKFTLPNAVQLDSDVLTWFKNQGRDYPEQINQILREYMALHDH
jgi:uncharacterized protein (DUF4415 family)